MASSIHLATSKNGSVTHNARENFSHSVVFTDEKNELWNNTKEAYKLYRQELAIRSKAYSDRTKQKLQKKTSTKLSAVVNLEKHHTFKDLEPIVKYLQNKLDTKVFQVAIHRDEGKLVSKEDGTELYSGKDFYKNPDDDKLYFDKKYTKEIDISNYEIKKNYHAHIEMMGIDSTGAAIRHNRMHKRFLKELQDFTAQTLQMERTYSKTKRLDTHQFKEAGQKAQQQKRATVKQVKAQFKQEREQLIQSHTATKEDHAELRRRYKLLEEQARQKELTIEKLDDYKDILFEDLKRLVKATGQILKKTNDVDIAIETIHKLKQKPEIEYVEKIVEVPIEKIVENPINRELKKKNKQLIYELERTKETIETQKATISSLKDDLNVSSSSMSDLKAQIRALEAQEPQEVEKIVYRTDADTQNKLISQQETILKQKATISSLKDDLNVSQANMSDLKARIAKPSLIDSKLAENNGQMMLEIGRLKATNSSLRNKLEDIKKIVGNFDFDLILQKIKEKFAPDPTPPAPQQETETEIFLQSEWERRLKKISEKKNIRERLK